MDDPPVGQVSKNKPFVKLSMFISPALTGNSQYSQWEPVFQCLWLPSDILFNNRSLSTHKVNPFKYVYFSLKCISICAASEQWKSFYNAGYTGSPL